MKKIYSAPLAEVHSMTIGSVMQAFSGIKDKGDGKLNQGLSNYENVLTDSDPTDGNLGKGGNIWDAWD